MPLDGHRAQPWACTTNAPPGKKRSAVHTRRRSRRCFSCSTLNWWALLESNQRPPPCEGDALPLSQAPNSSGNNSLAAGKLYCQSDLWNFCGSVLGVWVPCARLMRAERHSSHFLLVRPHVLERLADAARPELQVALGRRQRGVPEQVLDLPNIHRRFEPSARGLVPEVVPM